MESNQKVRNIVEELTRLAKAYYKGDSPVDDATFDQLETDLFSLDPNNPYFNRVAPPVEGKVLHDIPMLSLEKGKANADIATYLQRFLHEEGFVIMPKYDGLAIELHYVRTLGATYELKQASTRGDGLRGEDVTDKILLVENIPNTLDFDDHCIFPSIIIRGEMLMSYETFDDLITKGLIPEDSNIRNIVAGTLNSSDPILSRERGLEFVAYDSPTFHKTHQWYSEMMSFVQDMGLKTTQRFRIVGREVMQRISVDFTRGWSLGQEYLVDGLVIRVNDNKSFALAGSTTHHPKGAIAWKWKSETEKATITDVVWHLSRSGTVTPVAEFTEVVIGGAKIHRASLFNVSRFEALGIAIGAEVVVARQNDVIPYIESCASNTSDSFLIPTKCSSCGSDLVFVRRDKAETLHCSNKKCPAQVVGRMVHWCDAVGIEGMGESTAESLYAVGIDTIPKLYRIGEWTTQILLADNGIAKGKYRKLFKSIIGATRLPLRAFLAGLGIQGIGRTVSARVEEAFEKSGLEIESFLGVLFAGEIDGGLTGEVTRENLMKFVQDDGDLIDELLFIIKIKSGGDLLLTGKKFCITGSLGISRPEFKKLIEECGGWFQNHITADLDYLIVGEKSGGKVAKAEKAGATIIDENAFYEMIGFDVEQSDVEDDDDDGFCGLI